MERLRRSILVCCVHGLVVWRTFADCAVTDPIKLEQRAHEKLTEAGWYVTVVTLLDGQILS